MASASEVWSQLLAWVSLVLTIILLVPQAYLNYQKQSTEGLSIAMLWIFLAASVIPAAYYVYQSEPVALTLSWFGFAVVGIFVLCQVPYYSPTAEAAGGSEAQRLSRRKRHFVWRFALYVLVSSLCFVVIYFLFIVSGPSSAFSWLPSTVGYILPSALTVFGYLMQLRLILIEKDSSGISLGFIALDMSACFFTVLSIALDRWDGAAAAPLFVIFACQICMATLRLCIYPPHSAYKKELGLKHIDTAAEGADTQLEDDEEEDEEQEDEEAEETAEGRMEGGEEETSHTGHAQLDTSLHSTDQDEDEDERDQDVELVVVSGVDRGGLG